LEFRISAQYDMARRQIRISKAMLFTWLMLTGLICLFSPQRITNKLHFAFIKLIPLPILNAGLRTLSTAATSQSPTGYVSRRLYIQLENHAANLSAELDDTHKKLETLARLRDRFAFETAAFVVADIITLSINADRQELIINRGRADGLNHGQYVLGENGVIGTISDVSTGTAKVMLVTDTASRLPVKIAASDVYIRWKMQGNGKGGANIRMLPQKYKIKSADIVYADKKPGFLDAPVIVGRIQSFDPDEENPLLWDITVKPVCNIENLISVAVIVMNP